MFKCRPNARGSKYAAKVGDVFGKLTIIAGPFYLRKGDDEVYHHWVCDCSCGKYSIVVHHSLFRKYPTKSCGCTMGSEGRAKGAMLSRLKIKLGQPVERQLLAAAKHRAMRKGLEFSLVLDDIKIPELCPVFGIKLERKGKRTPSSPSIDRKDNNKGYTHDNICVISDRANRLKSDATIDEIRAILKYMDMS